MREVTLSSQNRVTLPREAREALNVKCGDKLLMLVRGQAIILIRKPQSFTDALHGLAKEPYPVGYLADERKSWD